MIPAFKYIKPVGWLLFGLLVYCCLFLHLDRIPFKVWDESLFAMRAYYLSTQGALLDNFDFFPSFSDYPNLKPPLGTFIQAISFQLLGYNELALRLPVAGFALATGILMITFCKKIISSRLAGATGALILFSSLGYISPHVARTGDHDVLIAFWVLASVLLFYLYLQSYNRRYFYLLVVVMLFGFLTKSVTIFFSLPGFLVYTLWQGQFRRLISQKSVYFGGLLLLLTICGYYLLMDHYIPGFMDRIQETVFGRYTGERNQQGHDLLYYVRQMIYPEFFPWVLMLPINIYQLFIQRNEQFKRISILLWCSLGSYLLIISFSATQLSWYEAPLYPIAALIAGLSIHQLLIQPKTRMVMIISGMIAYSWSFYQVIDHNMNYQLRQPEEQYAYLMKKLQDENPTIKSYTIYSNAFNGQVGFYSRLMNDLKGYDIKVMTYWQDDLAVPGSYLMLVTPEQRTKAKTYYQLELINGYKEVGLYRLSL